MDLPDQLKDFPGTVSASTFAVDSSRPDWCASSQPAQTQLREALNQALQACDGEAMECMFARNPGGCGNTVHCRACSIRKLVTGTVQRGQGVTREPAYLYTPEQDAIRKVRFTLSTELVGGLVLLRIDDISPQELLEREIAIDDFHGVPRVRSLL